MVKMFTIKSYLMHYCSFLMQSTDIKTQRDRILKAFELVSRSDWMMLVFIFRVQVISQNKCVMLHRAEM